MSEDLARRAAIVRARRRGLQAVALLALPAGVLFQAAAFRSPELVERVYARGLYPWVVGALGALQRPLPFALAEALAVALVVVAVAVIVRLVRAWPGLGAVGLGVWAAAGAALWAFLLSWGLNYARPPLWQRMDLDLAAIEAPEVLRLGRAMATRAAALRGQLEAEIGAEPLPAPAPLPLSFGALDRQLDAALVRLRLPGDELGPSPSPAKPLAASWILAHLGISGIYLPITAEPAINRLVPDPALPPVLAHEKAHQRGITDEGEANLVAVLACLQADDAYIRYTGALDAAARLIGSTARYLPREQVAEAWSELGPGPLADLRAISEFWRSYQGPATEMAGRVNDAYLRGNRVPGGVQSYQTVVRLLVGADRAGLLFEP